MISVAIPRITQNGMAAVIQVLPDLMTTAGSGMSADQAVARGFISPHGLIHHNLMEALKQRDCLLPGFIPVTSDAAVDDQFIRKPSPNQGPVFFFYFVVQHQTGQATGRVFVQGEKENSAGGLIQPVNRKNMTSQLITQDLEKEGVFIRIQVRTMYQHAGGFINNHQRVIPMKQFQFFHTRRSTQYSLFLQITASERI